MGADDEVGEGEDCVEMGAGILAGVGGRTDAAVFCLLNVPFFLANCSLIYSLVVCLFLI